MRLPVSSLLTTGSRPLSDTRGSKMEIGKPRRIHRVEPLKHPVPEKAPGPPDKAPASPKQVPAK